MAPVSSYASQRGGVAGRQSDRTEAGAGAQAGMLAVPQTRLHVLSRAGPVGRRQRARPRLHGNRTAEVVPDVPEFRVSESTLYLAPMMCLFKRGSLWSPPAAHRACTSQTHRYVMRSQRSTPDRPDRALRPGIPVSTPVVAAPAVRSWDDAIDVAERQLLRQRVDRASLGTLRKKRSIRSALRAIGAHSEGAGVESYMPIPS